MKKTRPTYRELEQRLAVAEPIIEALRHQEVDAVVGEEKIAFLLLRKVEEAWLESNGEFSAMFNLNGIGMFQADPPAFRFTRVNPKLCEVTGYSTDELLTRTYIELTHPGDRKRDLKTMARVIRGTSDTWFIEKRCIRGDGRVVWVLVHGLALRDHAGRAVRIMAMVEDITARRQAEQLQRDAQAPHEEQLEGRTAEMSRMLRSFRGQAVRRKLADQVVRAIQEFVDRSIGPAGGKPSARRSKASPRRKALRRKTERSGGRRTSGNPRAPSR